ncbi:MAG TPA: hypothetical protein VIL00_06495 [Pseudonocardiaceae bacterium]
MADLLSSITDDPDDDKPVDLLGGISEDGPEPWNPTEPDGIQGTVTAVLEEEGKYSDEPIPVVVIKTADGEFTIKGYRSVLRNEIKRVNPQVGGTFAVKYFGEKAKKNGEGRYHHYRVAYQGPAQPTAPTGPTAAPF